VVDGSIQLKKTNQDPPADFADIVTDGEYTKIDLKLEWKARPCIDGGVMFYVHESPEYHHTTTRASRCRLRIWPALFRTVASSWSVPATSST
jgi:hypothetical protein